MKISKKEQIDRSARELFFKYGLKKISIEEICKAAGVSRKTFYTYFDNKANLILHITQSVLEKGVADYMKIINEDIRFLEKLEKILRMKLEMSKTWSLDFISDLLSTDYKEVHDYYNKYTNHALQLLREWLLEGQEKGDINPGLNVDYIEWALRRQIEHFDSPELLKMFRNAEDMIRQSTHLLVYGLTPPEK